MQSGVLRTRRGPRNLESDTPRGVPFLQGNSLRLDGCAQPPAVRRIAPTARVVLTDRCMRLRPVFLLFVLAATGCLEPAADSGFGVDDSEAGATGGESTSSSGASDAGLADFFGTLRIDSCAAAVGDGPPMTFAFTRSPGTCNYRSSEGLFVSVWHSWATPGTYAVGQVAPLEATATVCTAATCTLSDTGTFTIKDAGGGFVTGTMDLHFEDGSSAQGQFRVEDCSRKRACM